MSTVADAAPLIINVAPTGMVPMKEQNAALPVTPDEIARDTELCAGAGASIVHLHARDEAGRPTWSPEVYRRIISAVRERAPDVIVCVSTSGRVFGDLEQRAAVLDIGGDERPDLASLTLGSLNFPQQASVNAPDTIRRLAERMHERGIVPELEIFDFGMVDYAKYLLEREVLRPPLYFNLLLGSLGTLSATPLNLAALAETLPAGSTWSAAGIGRFQFPVNAMAVAMGGHVRVGLEDNMWLDVDRTRPATNLALVERVARLAGACERAVSTPHDARRRILALDG